MQTAKSKAEAYVREKCPELKGVDSGRPVGSGYMDYPDIQLHHWLRVLPSRAYFVVTGGGILSIWETKSAWDSWHSPKDKGRIMDFSILTGQPASEADYQSFCDIVGI